MLNESVYGAGTSGEVQNESAELERGRLAQEVVDDWASAMENSPETTPQLMSQLKNTIETTRSTHNEAYTAALATELLQRVGTLNVSENVKTAARDYLGEVIAEHTVI